MSRSIQRQAAQYRQASFDWTSEGRGRYSATGPDGREYVIVPRYGFYGNNINAYEVYRDDDPEPIVVKKRLQDLLAHMEGLL